MCIKLVGIFFLITFYCTAGDIKISMQQTQISGMPLAGKGMSFEWDNNRSCWPTIGKVIIGAYVCTTAYLLYARYLLNNLCAWNNWKNPIPLSDLATMQQKNVHDLLVQSIEMRYNCPSGTFAMNLPQFLRDTALEIEILNTYKMLANSLRSVYLAPLFFISDDSIRQADEKIKRLRFMQTIIVGELDLREYSCMQRFTIFNFRNRKDLCAMQHA